MKTTTEELNELKIQLQELRYHRCKYYNITSYYTLKNGFPIFNKELIQYGKLN